MVKINNDIQVEITDDKECFVKLVYRCFLSENIALYPMTYEDSIYKGYTLKDLQNEAQSEFENQYIKVELVETYIEK